MPAGSAAHARASLPQAPDWLRTRGGSISIAPPGSTLVVTESTLPETRPLSGFNEASQAEQEQLLLEDLLYALVGIEGRYIRLVPSTKAGDDRVNFVASPYIKDASLVESLSRMLPLCSAYFSVQMYVQVHSRWEHGLVTNAFAAALRTILKEYLVLVAQLEFQFSQRKLTLLRAWYYLQSSFHSFLKLEQLCQKVHRTVGGAFLNVIHQSMTLAGDAATKSLYTHLLVHASIPYFDMLNAWLSQGVLRDVHGEFQICEHTERSKENVRKDFNDTYWDERYTVRQEKVPIFLAGVSEKILTTGKYLNVIRECARAIPPRDSSTDGILPLASFTPNERAYLDWIGTSYAHASRLLLDVLMHENDLLGHLRSLKRYFLGAQGDFFVDFMDAAEKEMEGKTKDVVITKLRTHLELALRSSRASIDPYGGDLSCQIQPFNLVQQLELIHSISATGGGGGGAAGGKDGAAGSAAQQQSALVASKRNEFLKGHEAFELSYRVRWPLSLVLSKKTLTKYQLLFRHLFAIKHAERQLNRCWATHQSLKELHFIDRKYHHAHGLRHRMLHFFTSMAYYIMVEVLEPNWHQLEQALMQVTTVDQVNYNAVNRVR
jgi:gamma-tubulin complex component 2